MDRVDRIAAAAEQIKARLVERDDMLADLKALLAPLDKIASLLPSAVKKILDKYRG